MQSHVRDLFLQCLCIPIEQNKICCIFLSNSTSLTTALMRFFQTNIINSNKQPISFNQTERLSTTSCKSAAQMRNQNKLQPGQEKQCEKETKSTRKVMYDRSKCEIKTRNNHTWTQILVRATESQQRSCYMRERLQQSNKKKKKKWRMHLISKLRKFATLTGIYSSWAYIWTCNQKNLG